MKEAIERVIGDIAKISMARAIIQKKTNSRDVKVVTIIATNVSFATFLIILYLFSASTLSDCSSVVSSSSSATSSLFLSDALALVL
ncbi:hypothetical protein SDC9_171408 [bioreactor metagenome]|uniref:Uncharacterized protein n=1 Tax=bioreactor metagenome TaxID=1076179 RepID=A0A645GBK0_9ZZZZ